MMANAPATMANAPPMMPNGPTTTANAPPMTANAPAITAAESSASASAAGNSNLKDLLDENRNKWTVWEEKRLQVQMDTQIQIARIQAASQERIMERQMQINKERDERQVQLIQGLLTSVVGMVKKD